MGEENSRKKALKVQTLMQESAGVLKKLQGGQMCPEMAEQGGEWRRRRKPVVKDIGSPCRNPGFYRGRWKPLKDFEHRCDTIPLMF